MGTKLVVIISTRARIDHVTSGRCWLWYLLYVCMYFSLSQPSSKDLRYHVPEKFVRNKNHFKIVCQNTLK